jgi:hypothetical protein
MRSGFFITEISNDKKNLGNFFDKVANNNKRQKL